MTVLCMRRFGLPVLNEVSKIRKDRETLGPEAAYMLNKKS